MGDLQQLIDRVEKLNPHEMLSFDISDEVADALGVGRRNAKVRNHLIPRALGGSLDASISLCERTLPGSWPAIDKYSVSDRAPDRWRAWVRRLEGDVEGDGPVGIRKGFGTGETPAIALILATLRALASQEEIAKGGGDG